MFVDVYFSNFSNNVTHKFHNVAFRWSAIKHSDMESKWSCIQTVTTWLYTFRECELINPKRIL